MLRPRPATLASPWIWSARTDVLAFGGSAAVALAFAPLAPWLAEPGGGLPGWGFLVFVLAVDVAHVHTTLVRTYLDGPELRRRPALYALVPIGCYLAGVALHLHSSALFWRLLAYVAAFHFVRQQVGWAAIYRARAGERGRLDRVLDTAVIYAATGYPLASWHARLPTAFHWFVEGDFVPCPWLAPLLPALAAVTLAIFAAYVARSIQRAMQGAPLNVGKHLVVGTTAITWYVGIVTTGTDYAFTVCNVVVHGVPYMVLLFAYARERATDAPATLTASVARSGFLGFLALVIGIAFVEELAWDKLVWHGDPWYFGGEHLRGLDLSALAQALVVPLLAVPQATHYVLDAVLWRRATTGPAQARALGFRPRGEVTSPAIGEHAA